MEGSYKELLKRSLALVLALAMFVTFFPLLGSDAAYAANREEGDGVGKITSDDLVEGNDYSGLCLYDGKFMTEDEVEAAVTAEEGIVDEAMINDLSAASVPENEETVLDELSAGDGEAHYAGSTSESQELCNSATGDRTVVDKIRAMIGADTLSAAEAAGEGDTDLYAQDAASGSYQIDEYGYANFYVMVDTVNYPGVTLRAYSVDGDYINTSIDGRTSASFGIDMTDFDIGYHTVIVTLNNTDEFIYWTYVPTDIQVSPTLRKSDFTAGYNGFNYYGNTSVYDSDHYEYYDVYLNYKKSGGSWSTTKYGPISYGKGVAGLKQGKKYSLRAFAAKQVEYSIDEQTYTFYGPASKAVTMKTAYKKTPIKSIKAKCLKQYSKKYRYKQILNTWWVGTTLWYRYRWRTGTAWYTKVKVTVKMKKKAGIGGIYISTKAGSKKAGKDKKTYTKNFKFSGKKRGKKITVKVQSYMSKTYGGWSKVTKKKVRVR